jgi:hypothetical protein
VTTPVRSPAGGAAVCRQEWNGQPRRQLDKASASPWSPSSDCPPGVGIAAGMQHTCAITGERRSWRWGFNGYGQVGDGSPTQRPAPVDVSGLEAGSGRGRDRARSQLCCRRRRCEMLGTQWQWAAGRRHHRSAPHARERKRILTQWCRRRHRGRVAHLCAGLRRAVSSAGASTLPVTWRRNDHTALSPVDVPGPTSGVVAISAGQNHTCAVVAKAGAACWGGQQ